MQHTTEDKILAIVAHLGFLTGIGYLIFPLVIWLVKKDSSPFVSAHAKQALVWQGSSLVLGSVLGFAGTAFSFLTAGFGLLLAVPAFMLLGILLLIPSILASVEVFKDQPYSYPVTGKYADRF